MGKPTHIILVRHGESEGNLDHSLFRIIPDHKIKLTPRGIRQAYEAGLRLRRDIIACDERVQFFVSPYERTRQTYVAVKRAITDGCTCQWNEEERGERIVYREEPRLREQDWGNFQHPPELMKEIREERKRFGHFFYRLPNGESGADVYDRLSTFIDTLHRAFEKPDFPSKCVIITHGLLIRLFLTRWFHYPFDEFEA
ncbi:histidine phosphatase superfamily, partial [Jimgerdemannia flammicorona]